MPEKSNMSYRSVAVEFVTRGGEVLLQTRAQGFETGYKEGSEKKVVTSADLDVNRALIAAIRERYPDHRISSEEGGEGAAAGEYEWLLDPIDGSANFARNIPHFAVCATLLEREVPIAAAVYNPVTKELFSFAKGEGVFLNDRSVRTSSVTQLRDAQAVYILGHNPPLWDWGVAVYRNLVEHCKKLKALGSSSLDLSFVAAGRADLVLYGTLSARDCAGAIAMVREAGGEVYAVPSGAPVTFDAAPQPVVAVANDALLKEVEPHLRRDLLPTQ